MEVGWGFEISAPSLGDLRPEAQGYLNLPRNPPPSVGRCCVAALISERARGTVSF